MYSRAAVARFLCSIVFVPQLSPTCAADNARSTTTDPLLAKKTQIMRIMGKCSKNNGKSIKILRMV